MKTIECIVRPSKIEAIQNSISELGIKGMTLTNVLGCGLQEGRIEVYRGYTLINHLFIRTKIELVVRDEIVNQVVDMITKVARTGEIGDGKIFVSSIDSSVRIRSSEIGNYAISF